MVILLSPIEATSVLAQLILISSKIPDSFILMFSAFLVLDKSPSNNTIRQMYLW